jgi:uncharacterized cupredoxin-like copper-binding protein
MFVLALSACGAPAAPAATSTPAGPQIVNVSLTTYGFKLTPSNIKAGDVKFVVKNDATDLMHEIILVKTDLAPDKMPIGSDNTSIDEDSKAITIVGAVEDVEPGKSGEVVMKLTAGHYVYFCNKDNHYKLGMVGELTIAP